MSAESRTLFVDAGADFDDARVYRYRLWRHWNVARRFVLFLMLNPSTADEAVLDPTVRRCVDFADRWGFGGLEVCNLFALRATDPKALSAFPGDPVGPANDAVLQERCAHAGVIVAAWGAQKFAATRAQQVRARLTDAGHTLWCLRTTKDGHPEHPLYLPKTLAAKEWHP